jgi:hypothetical protein
MCVENLKHNILSVIHICDQGHALTFDSGEYKIRKSNSGKLVAKQIRTPNNVYILDEINGENCFMG